jgi:hypothetical protein
MKNFDRMTVLAGAVVDMVAAAPFACNEEPHYLHDRTAAIEAVAKFLRKKIPGDHKLSPKKADRAYRKVYSVTWGTPAIDCLIGEISAATTSAEASRIAKAFDLEKVPRRYKKRVATYLREFTN